MKTPTSNVPICSICQKPVILETSKVDNFGKPVHEGCYLRNLNFAPDSGRSSRQWPSSREWHFRAIAHHKIAATLFANVWTTCFVSKTPTSLPGFLFVPVRWTTWSQCCVGCRVWLETM